MKGSHFYRNISNHLLADYEDSLKVDFLNKNNEWIGSIAQEKKSGLTLLGITSDEMVQNLDFAQTFLEARSLYNIYF